MGKGCLRGPGSPSSKAHLEDGVISILAWAVPRGMSPGDVEEFPFAIDPLEPWVLAAVHLGHQPGLQPHTAGRREGTWGRLVHGLQEKAGQGISRFAAQCSSGRGVWGRSGGPASGCWGFHFLPAPGAGVSPVPPGAQDQVPFPAFSFLVTGSLHLCRVWGQRKEGITAEVDAVGAPPRGPLPGRVSLPQLL